MLAACAPVIVAPHPIYPNLLGRIDYEGQFGAMVTDHTMIKPGSLLQANGGFIVIRIRDLLAQPQAYEGLKRALDQRAVAIEKTKCIQVACIDGRIGRLEFLERRAFFPAECVNERRRVTLPRTVDHGPSVGESLACTRWIPARSSVSNARVTAHFRFRWCRVSPRAAGFSSEARVLVRALRPSKR